MMSFGIDFLISGLVNDIIEISEVVSSNRFICSEQVNINSSKIIDVDISTL